MHLFREKCPLFFFLFLIIGSQIVAAQSNPPEQISIGQKTVPATDIDQNAAALPSFYRAAAEPGADAGGGREEVTKQPEAFQKAEIKDLKETLRELRTTAARFDDRSGEVQSLKNSPAKKRLLPVQSADDPKDDSSPARPEGFNWNGALKQSFLFLGIQHGYAVLGQQKTRRALKGNFWSDYVDSVKSIGGWDDGGRFFTNYVAHPMQGALTGFIYVQNSPQARREEFSGSKAYWASRMKAMLWSTVWSTQFEIGPISQASIGNVGQSGKQTWEDVIVTPTLGTAMMITEEALDRYLIKGIERRSNNFYVKIFARMLFNPVRIFSNLLRFREPWYRDRPPAR